MSVPNIDTQYRLSDNLTATQGRVFLTGTQALLRMLLAQKHRDTQAGLNTAGFLTGYRGSPLGGVDMAAWRHQNVLHEHSIRFLPAINEDLAATIIMGTQQAGVRQDQKVDGVFGMWYGKGPGVDRAGDALHHGNAAGASRHGGVLLVVGDDHTAASSSIPHASEQNLAAWRIPVIHPASIDEYELFGLWGWALSRYAGCWVAFKAITETVESGRSFSIATVPDFAVPHDDTRQGALQYSAGDFLTPAIELRMIKRLHAVQAFSRLHPLDRLVDAAPGARLGVVSTGKAYLDTTDALKDAGIPLPPLRHYKIGLSWPIDTVGLKQFSQGLDHILVIEEKSALIEQQIKNIMFNDERRPTVCGRLDLEQQPLIAESGQLDPDIVPGALRRWLHQSIGLDMPAQNTTVAPARPREVRRPYFCPGCPHSTSTRVPEGSEALGGVGCHYMATWMDRSTGGLTQMGGEGADWIGLSGYTRQPHVFQNMGEGTYFHSGYLAIRQAIAAGTTITYKILFNDAVAMTGGQAVDGPISVPRICQQLRGEGVERIAITSDDPGKYKGIALPEGVTVDHRRELERIQRELRETNGVSVLIHDQECAAEKRRRRKHGRFPDPARWLFINTDVCEGCGDCGLKSNCLSLLPVETPFGRKRAIDPSSCNKDYSCLDGFCPSFVSVMGGKPRKQRARASDNKAPGLDALLEQLPDPVEAPRKEVCNILVAGIGGTGVVTAGAILAMAAHLESRAASVLDITGLAQKGGTVISHIRISNDQKPGGAVRIHAAQADVAILCDPVAGTAPQVLATLRQGITHTSINRWLAPTSEFTHNPDVELNPEALIQTIRDAAGPDTTWLLDAHSASRQHLGDSIPSTMMMLGFSWQRGSIPVSEAAIMQALTLNGVAVSANQEAFRLGRLAAWKPDVLALSNEAPRRPELIRAPQSLEETLERCHASLTAYQGTAYANEYLKTVRAVEQAEAALRPGASPILTIKVAQSLHKLMAYKDEYEVARLFTRPEFRHRLDEQFEGEYSLRFHLAPPILARRDPVSGIPRKIEFGPWLETVFRVLAYGRYLRGSWLDIFSYTQERRMERRLIRDYRRALEIMTAELSETSFPLALELADLPLQVRGFGHVKARHAVPYEQRLVELVDALRKDDTITAGHAAYGPD